MVGKTVIYQLLVRAFGSRKCTPGGSFEVNGSGRFADIGDAELKRLKKLSVGAVWYTGVISHATKTHFDGVPDCSPSIVKGEAGSPYAIRDWFDVDPALAEDPLRRMEEFEALVIRTHQAGMKVLIDFIPNHVYREYSGFFNDSNFYLLDDSLHLPASLGSGYVENPARATGNNVFHAWPSESDWYETVKLNYGNRGTWDKMLEVLRFWVAKGVDGFRCDMVELVPAEFFSWAIAEVRRQAPYTMFVAEVYDKSNYRRYADAGFDLLYDKSGFYDTLRGIVAGTLPASAITRQWQELGDLQPRMLNFLENHDEQRVASDFFAGSGKRAFAALSVSLLFNTAPFLIYFGQEYGERGMESEGFSGPDGRTSIFDYCTVPSLVRGLNGTLTVDETVVYKEYCRLMRIATADALFSKGATYDLMYANPSSGRFDPSKQFAWMRSHSGAAMVVVANFSDAPVSVDVFIPRAAFEFAGIDSGDRTIKVKIGPNDYARTDVSR